MNDDEILFRVDDACIAFEDAWLANQIPRLDDFLGEFTGAERRVLLEQLIALDIEYRLNRGETPTRAAYTQRYPELSEAPTEADTKNARPPLDPLALVPGDDLGGYVIVREIGRGGMGVVYEAAQRVLSRRVALKVLPGFGLASDIAIARFERETKAIARLHHSNVVPFFEAGSDRGVHFYAMQLIEGRALDDLLRDDVERDGAQLRRMADFIRQAARAIAYAHGRGVMHRDLKPSNLLVDHDQTVWVTDFGLAKLTDEAMTHTGEMIGTLRYMSPERLVGKGDARAEVYALGATLYEAITARPVFTACDNVELMELIRNRDPETPSKLNAAIPLDLETIVVKALEKEPERRYESAAAFADDLERFLDDRPITARRAGPIERTLRWARRNKAMAGLIAAGIVFAIGASIAAIVFQQQSELNDDLRIDATVARDETRLNLYYAEMSLAAREAVASTGFAAMRDITERWLPAPGQTDPRGWEWYLFRSLSTKRYRESRHRGYCYHPAWSVDGEWLALCSFDELIVIDAETDEVVARPDYPGGYSRAVEFSPNGSSLLAVTETHAFVWSTASWTVVAELPRPESPKFAAATWHPDGRSLAILDERANLRIWRPFDDELITLFEGDSPTHLRSFAFDRDGKRLAIEYPTGNITLIDATDGSVNRSIPVGRSPLLSIDWSPGNRHLVVGGFDHEMRFFDVERGVEVSRGLHDGRVRSVNWHPDGTRAVSASLDFMVRVWRPDSKLPVDVLSGHTNEVWRARWRPDGGRVASAGPDDRVLIWDMEAPAAHRVFGAQRSRPSEFKENGLSFDPRGDRVVSWDGGSTHVWDTHSGKVDHEVAGFATASWSPDGRHLALARRPGIEILESRSFSSVAEIPRLPGPVSLPKVAWHPDGRRLACAEFYGNLRIVGDFERPGAPLLEVKLDAIEGLAWSPDGRWLAVVTNEGLVVFDSENLETTRRPVAARGALCELAWSPDGSRLWVAELLGGFVELSTADWEPIGRLTGHTHRVESIAVSPDGLRIATASRDRTVRVWNAKERRLCFSFRLPEGVGGLDWSPDGRTLAARRLDGPLLIWDATTAYEAELETRR